MPLVIGMDEAGYGPNLGPLVVTVTVWEVPGPPDEIDFWTALVEAVTRQPVRGDARLHVADSKQVYSPSRGLKELERSVLASLDLCGRRPDRFRALSQCLTADDPAALDVEPWFAGCDLPLPREPHTEPLDGPAQRWKECCRQQRLRLRAVRSDIVLTERFNRLTRECGSKGLALSHLSLELLRMVWAPDDEPALVVADKHGGRNRYDHLLSDVFGRLPLCLHESAEQSRYRLGAGEVRFQTRAEAHLPVALASMVSKYVRELAMVLFNRFWHRHLPGLAPTKGYPTDARRFRREIAAVQKLLGILDEALWRER